MNLQETHVLIKADKLTTIDNSTSITTQYGDVLLEQHQEGIYTATLNEHCCIASTPTIAFIDLIAALKSYNQFYSRENY